MLMLRRRTIIPKNKTPACSDTMTTKVDKPHKKIKSHWVHFEKLYQTLMWRAHQHEDTLNRRRTSQGIKYNGLRVLESIYSRCVARRDQTS